MWEIRIKGFILLVYALLLLPNLLIFDMIPRLFGYRGFIGWYLKEMDGAEIMAPVMFVYVMLTINYILLWVAQANNFI